MSENKTQEPKKKEPVVKEPKKPQQSTATYYEAVGRRKSATARVRLYVTKEETMMIDGKEVTKGNFLVNGRSGAQYFPGEIMKKMFMEPFRTTNTMNRFIVSSKIVGGGLHGQLEAFIHCVSRALEKVDKEKFRPILKKRGFLTRDARVRERRKPNTGGKARRRKQSPKR
ncbi:30S ribosomal protein S9 [Patescibacteria group bacterium]|nr:30S ribosomal protein S9 [Patescibacteria group bacterium]